MPITNALRDELVKYFSVTDIVNKNTYDGQPSTPSDLEQSEMNLICKNLKLTFRQS